MIFTLNTKRYGRFQIMFDIINTRPEKVQEVLGNMIVVQAEPNYIEKSIIYVAVGDIFEEVPEGRAIPDYNLSFEGGKLKATRL